MNLAIASRTFGGGAGEFAHDFLEGLCRTPKRVPCKYFYDAAGARLFERICTLPEYYQTRTELRILKAHAREIAALMGDHATLVEFGAGSPCKARILLSALDRPHAYVPVDICPPLESVLHLAQDFDGLSVCPLLADFTLPLALPFAHGEALRCASFFPGSTIGNFTRSEALSFLCSVRTLLRGGGLLVGVDMVKDPAILHAAYNDASGVTAMFNRNILVRANRELGANFDPSLFDHYAPYNVAARRIEMYLVSRTRQQVHLAGREFLFAEGEALHTENSHKYTPAAFRELVEEAGFSVRAVWTDADNLFGVHWLVPARSAHILEFGTA